MTKRWPVLLAIFIGLIAAAVVSRDVWVRLGVFVAVESTDGSRNEQKAPDIRYRWERG